jgi:RNA polymerase subunit RPABC4/transcription elongation factor Spt4
MLDFVKGAFRGGINVLLWINLILCTIGGGVAGYYLGGLISYSSVGYVFGGVLIGIVLGLLTDIIGGGFIVTILSIDENLETIKKNLSNTGIPSSGNYSGFVGNDKKCRSCGKMFSGSYSACPYCGSSSYEETTEKVMPISPIVNVGDSWVCKKCSERNPNTSSTCKGCGAYK